jgi:ABC-type nickel/cobalt efflux system permease component RcnA
MLMIIRIRMRAEAPGVCRRWCTGMASLFGLAAVLCLPGIGRADTVASLLGNFTINQYCGLNLARDAVIVHYAAVFGQLPALRELHLADADGNGVTSQAERDAYVGQLAAGLARGLKLKVDGTPLPLHVVSWTSSLPKEQGGFSLRVDVEFNAALPAAVADTHALTFNNDNYAGRLGWHEIVVRSGAPAIYDTNAYSSSLTGGLTDALTSLPAAGPLDERQVHLRFTNGGLPAGATPLTDRSGKPAASNSAGAYGRLTDGMAAVESAWIARQTRHLVEAISAPTVAPSVALVALLGALLLGAVHALSPGHGKTIVGAYLIGSRGTARHAAFLGLTVTVTHTLGVFVLGFATLYASRFIVPERLFPVLSVISAVLVLGMGSALLLQRLRELKSARSIITSDQPAIIHPAETVFRRIDADDRAMTRSLLFAPHSHVGQAHSHGSGMHSHGGRMHSHLPPGAAGEKITWSSLVTLGVSGGLVPCPSAMVLLLAAVALNKTAYGMVLVVAFSLGLALTLTAVGLIFLHARSRLPNQSGARWQRLVPVVSAAAITLFGVMLCAAAYRSFTVTG